MGTNKPEDSEGKAENTAKTGAVTCEPLRNHNPSLAPQEEEPNDAPPEDKVPLRATEHGTASASAGTMGSVQLAARWPIFQLDVLMTQWDQHKVIASGSTNGLFDCTSNVKSPKR